MFGYIACLTHAQTPFQWKHNEPKHYYTKRGGVREGVLSLLLTNVLPLATATRVVLLARLWTLAAKRH